MAESLPEGVKLSREHKKIDTSVDGGGNPLSPKPLYTAFGTHPLYEETKRPELIFTVGLPASGKTTWAREQVENNRNIVRVSRDDLRNMRGLYWIPEQEDMISEWEIHATLIALNSGKSVIVDATNLSKTRRCNFVNHVNEFMKSINQTTEFTVQTKIFDTSVEECIKRDEERTVETGKVGKKVILKMAKRYGLETVYPEYEFQEGLPSAIICDLDGTLAKNITGRGFYDWSRVGEDTVDRTIKQILDNAHESVFIIIMSGRDGVCRPETTQWLHDNDIQFKELLMRAQGDNRKDSVVKRELFDFFVKHSYNVLFALDDRDQVVDMWRKELGIKCLQVNYGDF